VVYYYSTDIKVNFKASYKMDIKREELEKLVGVEKVDVFYAIADMITSLYDMEQTRNNGGKKRTYEYKFRKSGKTLCAFYFKENTLGLMFVFGKDERAKVDEMKNEFSSVVVDAYDNTPTYATGNGLCSI
jgi:hypothetical protein